MMYESVRKALHLLAWSIVAVVMMTVESTASLAVHTTDSYSFSGIAGGAALTAGTAYSFGVSGFDSGSTGAVTFTVIDATVGIDASIGRWGFSCLDNCLDNANLTQTCTDVARSSNGTGIGSDSAIVGLVSQGGLLAGTTVTIVPVNGGDAYNVTDFISDTVSVSVVPLPTAFDGAGVRVTIQQVAPLFFVSPDQVNYWLPAGVAGRAGDLTLTVNGGTTMTASGTDTNSGLSFAPITLAVHRATCTACTTAEFISATATTAGTCKLPLGCRHGQLRRPGSGQCTFAPTPAVIALDPMIVDSATLDGVSDCSVSFNFLIGDEHVRTATGHNGPSAARPLLSLAALETLAVGITDPVRLHERAGLPPSLNVHRSQSSDLHI